MNEVKRYVGGGKLAEDWAWCDTSSVVTLRPLDAMPGDTPDFIAEPPQRAPLHPTTPYVESLMIRVLATGEAGPWIWW